MAPSRRQITALCGAVALTIVLGGVGARADTGKCPWVDSNQPVDLRAAQVVKRMTLDEKITTVHDADPIIFAHYGAAGYIPGIPRLCMPDLVFADGASGVAQESQLTTAYPAGIAKAASFDLALQAEFGRALGREAWQKGVNVMLTPMVNLARNPQYGRNGESFGEDPVLAARSAVATINGIQENPVIADVKHYAMNDQGNNQAMIDVRVTERRMRELDLIPFEAAVKQAHAGSVMCSINKVNGTHSCSNSWLLDRVLRHDWGFPGFVISDWGATHAVTDAVAGLDVEMGDANLPGLPTSTANPNGTVGREPYFGQPLKAAVNSGKIPVRILDRMVSRIVRTMLERGLFSSPPPAQPGAFVTPTQTVAAIGLARRIAEEGTVLLKNEADILPLRGGGQRIAVLGPSAGPHGTALAYSSAGSPHVPTVGAPLGLVSPLEGISREAAAHGDTVTYADGSSQADAAAVAAAADVAVVFVYDAETEGYDRTDLTLHSGVCQFPLPCFHDGLDQDALIKTVAAANPNTIVVINSGGPVLMPWLPQVKGLFQAWYPGQEDGNAIASLLYGRVNPSAKLPMTFPRSLRDIPASTPQQYPGVKNRVEYSEGLLVGYRWYQAKRIQPLFPFGFGLSYSRFTVHDLQVDDRAPGPRVRVTIRNVGRRAGAEVIQVYVGMPRSAGEPPLQLKAFTKVFLQPGQQQTVTLALDSRAFSVWSTSGHRWQVLPGCYRLRVGTSSTNLPLTATVSRREVECPGGQAR